MKTKSFKITPHMDPENPMVYTFVELHGMTAIFTKAPKERSGMFFLDRTLEDEVNKFLHERSKQGVIEQLADHCGENI